MNKTDDGLIREIDDAVRHDRLLALWQRHRKPLLLAVAALLVATTAAALWTQYKDKRAGEALQQFVQARAHYDAGAYAAAADGFAATAKAALSGNMQDMAGLWQARAYAKAGDDAQAMTHLVQLADNPKGTDLIWRDLACLRLASRDAAKAGGCLAAAASPLEGERALVRAALLWQTGEHAQAAALLGRWATDAEASPAVREQAQRALTVVAGDAQS